MRSLKMIVKLLREAPEEKELDDSLDSQVDNLFSDFEKEAKNLKKEGKDFRSFVRRFLTEAEEDEKEEDKEEEEKKPDEDKKDESGEPEDEEAEKKKLTIDDIDMTSFANSVVRLIDNYDSLLEVRNTILRRAHNFLMKSYEPSVADSFDETLEEVHGMQVGKSKFDKDDDDFQPPAAARAGTSPGA